jgi:hypothetical protein
VTFNFDNTTTNVVTMETVNLNQLNSSSATATFTTTSLSAPLPAGTYTVTATYNGSSTFISEISPAITQQVAQATSSTNIIVTTSNSVYGQSVSMIATVSPEFAGTPTGTVSFYTNGSTTPLATVAVVTKAGITTATFTTKNLPPNSYSITATYNGNLNFESSSATATAFLTVSKDGTHMALAASQTSSNTSVTFTATVIANAPGTGVPTGLVGFTVDGVFAGYVTVNANGQAALTFPNGFSKGDHTITVQYEGDGDFIGSSLTETFDFIVGRGT